MLRTGRQSKKLTQKQVAARMPGECDGTQVSKWELGKGRPSEERMSALIVELNLDADRARSAWFQWLLDKARDDAKQARQPDET